MIAATTKGPGQRALQPGALPEEQVDAAAVQLLAFRLRAETVHGQVRGGCDDSRGFGIPGPALSAGDGGEGMGPERGELDHASGLVDQVCEVVRNYWLFCGKPGWGFNEMCECEREEEGAYYVYCLFFLPKTKVYYSGAERLREFFLSFFP